MSQIMRWYMSNTYGRLVSIINSSSTRDCTWSHFIFNQKIALRVARHVNLWSLRLMQFWMRSVLDKKLLINRHPSSLKVRVWISTHPSYIERPFTRLPRSCQGTPANYESDSHPDFGRSHASFPSSPCPDPSPPIPLNFFSPNK